MPYSAAMDRPDFHLKVLEDIGDLVNQERGLNSILRGVVRRVAESLILDVVSVYLHDPENHELVMRATHGLDVDPANPVRMPENEGLTGLAFSQRRTVKANPASGHEAFKFFPDIGEERYESYIGVPIMLRGRCLGVLVCQGDKRRVIHPAEQTLLHIVASRLAGLLEVADRLDRLQKPETGQPGRDRTGKRTLHGKGVSSGFAVGRVLLFQGLFQQISLDGFSSAGVRRELRRLGTAFKKAENELKAFIKRLEREKLLTRSETAIFQAHLYIVKDPSFRRTIERVVERDNAAAEVAVVKGVERIISQFEQHGSPMLQDRAADIREIGERLLAGLLNKDQPGDPEVTSAGAVLVAHDIGPAYLAKLGAEHPAALITESGGETSHAAILAKSLGIPAVVGVENAVHMLASGREVLVDGKTGFIFLDPEQGLITEYKESLEKQAELNKVIERETEDVIAETPHFRVTANVGFPSDVAMAREMSIRDVGLYRTEFTFMRFSKWPTVDQQVEVYTEVAKNFEGYVTVRTLDIGADKMLPYFHFPKEDNPLLGLRSIRFSMEYLSFFRDQVDAILRSCLQGYRYRILLPMVSYMWEVETAAEILDERCMRLGVRAPHRPQLGIMVEVPALLYQIEDYKELIDFVSVGSNDLIQYMLAVDRNSNVVGYLYSGFHPGVIRMFRGLVRSVRNMDKSLSVCGEIAATPAGALALAGLGCDNFSVTPNRAPVLRYLAKKVSREMLEEVGRELPELTHEKDVRRYLAEKIEAIDPILNEAE
ncbi:MAG: phosphoenolpyruvate--protein phosphotransferase [Desulfatibacillaceae bacterium]